MHVFLEGCRISRVLNAVAAGTSAQTSSPVDMAADGSYDGVIFIALFGALTATQVTSLKAQQSSDDGAADAYSDLADSLVGPLQDADSNKALAVDIYRPQKRYLKAVIGRGTANAVIDGMLAIQYRGRKCPVSQAAAIAASAKLVSPEEGTA